jgi:hypothetical protein
VKVATSKAKTAIEPIAMPAIAPLLGLWDFVEEMVWVGVVVVLAEAVELVEPEEEMLLLLLLLLVEAMLLVVVVVASVMLM